MLKLLKSLRIATSGRVATSYFSPWRPDLKVWHHFFSQILSIGRMVTGGLSKSRVFQCAIFARFVSILVRRSGKKGCAIYLKTCHVLLMQGIPSSKLHAPSSRAIAKTGVAVTRDHLPRFIPPFARNIIRKGDPSTIRLWLSLIGLYRLLKYDAKAKTETITNPGVYISPYFLDQFNAFVRYRFLNNVTEITYGDNLVGVDPSILKPKLEAITSRSADRPRGFDLSSTGIRVSAARDWVKGNWNMSLQTFLESISQVGTTKSLWTIIEDCASTYTGPEVQSNVTGSHVGSNWNLIRDDRSNPISFMGKISEKLEPAGKVRIFAIVDFWTQTALKPLHTYIMDILKEIPQDGTFHQERPLKELFKLVSKDTVIYSYDLSAATDRLPVTLQTIILKVMFNDEFAQAWKDLLVGRPYRHGRKLLYYAVGQPIGAYSSWAILAFSHHCIVQFAAFLAGHREWFRLYAVLGDDVVIADDKVAQQYRFICDTIGLEIGLAKSLVADDLTAEFAKRFFYKGEDLSGLPHTLWVAAQQSVSVAHALVARVTSQCPSSASNIATALGSGYRGASSLAGRWEAIPRRLRVLFCILTHPSSITAFKRSDWLGWLRSKGPLTTDALELQMSQFTPWASSLLTQVVTPALEAVEDKAAELFFGDTELDLAGRLIDTASNNALVKAQDSLDKATASLKHLAKLNVKFLPHQSAAIFNQITMVVDRVSNIPSCTSLASPSSGNDGEIARKIHGTDIYQVFLRVRRHATRPLDAVDHVKELVYDTR
jgi:hypothetical protein